MNITRQQITVIGLAALTLALIIFAIVIAVQISTPGTPTAPEDTEAATGTAICGQSCNVDSDCRPSTGGAAVICHNGQCANANCPTDTQPGTICYCKTPSGRCGDPCGKNQLPLCNPNPTDGSAPSECGFVGGINQCRESIANNQFCLPKQPTHDYTLSRCNGVAAMALFRPDGSPATTRAEVLEACSREIRCGDGIREGNEQCDDGNSVSGDGCSSACQTESTSTPPPPPAVVPPPAATPPPSQLPDTALISDEFDRILIAAILLIAGFTFIQARNSVRSGTEQLMADTATELATSTVAAVTEHSARRKAYRSTIRHN